MKKKKKKKKKEEDRLLVAGLSLRSPWFEPSSNYI
jgi:hypothetical protein